MKKEVLELLGVVTLLLVAMAYFPFVAGFILYKFYYWFLLPVYTGLVHINYWDAVGLSLFTLVIKSHNSTIIKKEYRQKTNETLASILGPWIVLGIGYLVHLIL